MEENVETETEAVSSGSGSENDELAEHEIEHPIQPQVTKSKGKSTGKSTPGTVFSYFTPYFTREPAGKPGGSSSRDANANIATAPADKNGKARKRKLQKTDHYCVYKKCLKTISRGNKYNRLRHKQIHHQSHPDYDENKHILQGDHKNVLKLLKEMKGAGETQQSEKCLYSERTEDLQEGEELAKKTNEEGEKGVESEQDEEENHSELVNVQADTTDSVFEYDVEGEDNTGLINPERYKNVSDFEDDEVLVRRKDSELDLAQSTIPFKKIEREEMQQENLGGEKVEYEMLNEKLNIILEKLTISSSHQNDELPEAVEAVGIVKGAKNITDTYGSGIAFFPGESEAIVRCDVCFAYNCENDPSLHNKDPFFVGHINNASHGGKSIALGLVIDSEKMEKYLQGHNQEWFRFKTTLVAHVSCKSSKSGGTQHYQAIIAKKRRDKREKTILNVVCNQLRTAVTVIKSKSAASHYEDLIGLLHSSGAAVGNLGHGRKQINQMLKAFQTYFYIKLRKHMQTPLPSTGIPPHFSTTSDKSTPIRVTNHAIMVVLMVDGEKEAIPIAAPPVYNFGQVELEGGDAPHLADQVISTLIKTAKIPESSIQYLMSHQADGQYQAREFGERLKERVFRGNRPVNLDKFFVIPWDTAHWMDCCLSDVRVKEENGLVLRRLIQRTNKFHNMFGRGRGYAEYKGLTQELKLSSFTTSAYSTTRFASSAFEIFEKIYNNYEGLAKTYERLRETFDEEEETRYMIKGRDFCIDLCGLLDILSPLMDMMVRLQALDSLIWSITKLWPRVRQRLVEAKEEIANQINSDEPQFDKNLQPKLNKHFQLLNEDSAYDCTFQNVSLTPGWMIVEEKDMPDQTTKGKKKSKIYEWVDRSPDDCLTEMVCFIETLLENMDKRYTSSVTDAAHILGKCLDIPGIYTHLQGTSPQLTATQMASIQEHGKKQFHEFFSYVCSLPHIKDLSNADSSLKFIDVLGQSVHTLFKSTIVEVIWNNLGNCRSVWFPPISDPLSTGPLVKHGGSLSGFLVKTCPTSIDNFCEFIYENVCVYTKFDEKAAFSSMYTNEEIYNRLGKEMCVVIDIALAMSGSEAVVESYYSVMGSQTMPGGQDNETLEARTNVDWCFPKSTHCEETLKEIAHLYIYGNKEFDLKPHQIPIFVDERGRAQAKYRQGGKVLDRLSKKDKRSIFLADQDK